MESEMVQVFNHVPRSREELVMVLEDAEERFGEEVLDEMLGAIGDVLVHGKGLDDIEWPEDSESSSERGKSDEGVDDGHSGEGAARGGLESAIDREER